MRGSVYRITCDKCGRSTEFKMDRSHASQPYQIEQLRKQGWTLGKFDTCYRCNANKKEAQKK